MLLQIVLVGAGAGAGLAQTKPAAPEKPSVEVTIVPLRREVVKDRIKAFGAVTTPQSATSDVSFQHAGQVARIDVQTGQRVKAGDPLVEVTTDPAAALSYRNALAAASFAQRDSDRVKALLVQHLATNAQVATAAKAVADAQAALATERSLGNDKGQEVARAANDGFVAIISVSVGDRIAANTSILKLTRTDLAPRVTIGLEPDVAHRVQPGMVAMAAPVYGSGEAPAIRGIVQGVSATLDPATHLIGAFVELPAGGTPLAPGVSIAATIIAAQHEGWVLPRQAVLHDGKGDYLFAVSSGIAHRKDVSVGLQSDKTIEILGDPDLTLRVVTVGNYELKDGMAVREAPAPPAKP